MTMVVDEGRQALHEMETLETLQEPWGSACNRRSGDGREREGGGEAGLHRRGGEGRAYTSSRYCGSPSATPLVPCVSPAGGAALGKIQHPSPIAAHPPPFEAKGGVPRTGPPPGRGPSCGGRTSQPSGSRRTLGCGGWRIPWIPRGRFALLGINPPSSTAQKRTLISPTPPLYNPPFSAVFRAPEGYTWCATPNEKGQKKIFGPRALGPTWDRGYIRRAVGNLNQTSNTTPKSYPHPPPYLPRYTNPNSHPLTVTSGFK